MWRTEQRTPQSTFKGRRGKPSSQADAQVCSRRAVQVGIKRNVSAVNGKSFGTMAVAKVVSFLRSDKPGVLALTGTTGCGKRHAIAEAALQLGVAVTHHDLAQSAIEWGRLGNQQLTSTGLMRNVHVISNASEQFLKDFTIVKKTQAKIILVADDAGPGMRACGVPIVRMQAMSSDAMSKKLFLEMDWPAEDAVRAAKAAGGDWHQLRAQQHFGATAVGEAE